MDTAQKVWGLIALASFLIAFGTSMWYRNKP